MIPDIPERFADLPRVATVPPPASMLGDVSKLVNDAVAHLQADQHGKLVWIATTTGVNFALVQKVHNGSRVNANVVLWLGKTWGQPLAAGIAGTVDW